MKKEVLILFLVLILLSGCIQPSTELSPRSLTPEEQQLSLEFKKCESITAEKTAINCKESLLKRYLNLNEREQCSLAIDPILTIKCKALFYHKTAFELNNRIFCRFISTDNLNPDNIKEITKIKEDCLRANKPLSRVTTSLEKIKTQIREEQTPKNFYEWLDTFPMYYSEIDEDYYYQTKLALDSNNIELCENIIDEERSEKSRKATIKCQSEMFPKLKAFLEKDYNECKDLYSDKNPSTYEECIAPVLAYSAISIKDKSLCNKYLTTKRIINLCENDYEKFN